MGVEEVLEREVVDPQVRWLVLELALGSQDQDLAGLVPENWG